MLSLEEAREALGLAGRKLSDDQVRLRAEEANGLARMLLDLWRRHKENAAAAKERRSEAA